MSSFVTVDVSNGVELVRYNPTVKMKMFAAFRANPQYAKFSDEQLLKKIGLRERTCDEWRKTLGHHFDDWLEEFVSQLMPDNFKIALEAVGAQRALEGDFQFWKPFAIREKVISPDTATLNVIPSNLGAFDNLDEQNIDAIRNTLLSGLRAVEDKGELDMAQDASRGESESDSERASPMPE